MWRLGAILLLAGVAHAQAIVGTVTDSVTHAPIPNVMLTLFGVTRYGVTTSETGSFQLEDVKPGKYYLNVMKPGYVLAPSQRDVQVARDMRLDIEMDPLGRIEVRVRYADGRPAPRAQVWLSAAPNGALRGATADVGGRFAFADLQPGEYHVRAAGNSRDPKPEGEIWAPTWFPSAIDGAAAEAIGVSNGATATADIRLRSVAARRIAGLVRDDAGRPAQGATVSILSPGEEQNFFTGEDGEFEFVVHDGEWRLSAVRKDAGGERRGVTTVFVARHDVENAAIRLALPFSVPVIFDRDGPAERQSFLVTLRPVDAAAPNPIAFAPDANRTAIQNVYPGRYEIQCLDSTPGYYLESIKVGQAEVLRRPIDIWDGSAPIRITYRSGAGVLSGVVTDGPRATVVVVNADEPASAARIRSFIVASGGRFEISTLRPGDYYVFAVEHAGPEIASPGFLNAVLPRAEKVHLEKGGAVALSLKLTQWPE